MAYIIKSEKEEDYKGVEAGLGKFSKLIIEEIENMKAQEMVDHINKLLRAMPDRDAPKFDEEIL